MGKGCLERLNELGVVVVGLDAAVSPSLRILATAAEGLTNSSEHHALRRSSALLKASTTRTSTLH